MTTSLFFMILDSIGFHVISLLLSIFWQSTVLFCVIALTVYILRRNKASVRHLFWVSLICMIPIIPFFAWFFSVTGTTKSEIPVLPSYSPPALALTETPVFDSSVSDLEEIPVTSVNVNFNPMNYVWAFAFLGYAIVALLFFSAVILGKIRIRRWIYHGKVITDRKLLHVFEEARIHLNIKKNFIVVEHEDVPVPLTVGTFHPVLLLPTDYADYLTDFELSALALHEYSHVKRYDALIFSIISIIRSIFFFNPLVWIAAHNVATLAEDACDEMVIDYVEDPIEYAEMLTKLAVKIKKGYFASELVAGFIFSRHIFLRRIEKILSDRKDQLLTISKPVLSGMFTVIGLTLMFVFLVPLGEVISQTSDGLVTFRAKVIDSQTGKPVANVRFSSYKHKEIEGVSNQDGMVEIPGMMPGPFSFVIKSENYTRCLSKKARNDIGKKEIYTSDGWRFHTDELKFKLKPGMKPVEIVIEKGVRITGHVYDPDGNPVAGATVAPALTGTGNSITGDSRFSFPTNEDGSYEMILPASGRAEYNLIAHDGKICEWRNWANGFSEPFKTEIGEEIHNFDLYLNRPSTVKGRVVDEHGNPPAIRSVRSVPADKRGNPLYNPETETDENGNFSLNFISPGKNYILSFPFAVGTKKYTEYTGKIITLKSGDILEDITISGDDKFRIQNE